MFWWWRGRRQAEALGLRLVSLSQEKAELELRRAEAVQTLRQLQNEAALAALEEAEVDAARKKKTAADSISSADESRLVISGPGAASKKKETDSPVVDRHIFYVHRSIHKHA